jgi:ubiquinone biosynthesis protein COQ9
MDQGVTEMRARLLDAILMHVPFDGWSEASLTAATRDLNMSRDEVRALCPRGAIDLAADFHKRGDTALALALAQADLGAMRMRERVAFAVRTRLGASDDKEVVRRGTTLFALPQHAPEGAKLIWGTADTIWDALGDTSDDFNWYSKRAILSGVYSSTVLFWLGDDSVGEQATWAFLDRRIEDVMRFEKVKGQVNDNKLLKGLFAGPNWLLSRIKPPSREMRTDLPGRWPGR